MRKAVVMCSGGVDSVTTLYYVAKVIRASPILVINADYGQRMAKEERWCVKKAVEDLQQQAFCVSYKEIDISWMKDLSTSLLVKENVPVPETPQEDIWDAEKAKNRILRWWDVVRNTMLLTIGLAHAEHYDLDSYIKTNQRDIYDVYIGIRREGPVMMKDNTPEFVAEMNRLVEHATHFGGYKISAPLLDLDKDGVVALGKALGVNFLYTYSCYQGWDWTDKGEPIHCGFCSNCRRRKEAFELAGITDPSKYAK
jgi:7-cyano-7-deazaguanine synthase